jgi:hypothetical protein
MKHLMNQIRAQRCALSLRRAAACSLGMCFLALSARAGAADLSPEPGATSRASAGMSFTGRLAAGLGGGTFGVAGHLGAQLDVWLSQRLGIGVSLARSGQAEIMGDSLASWTVGPELVVRSRPSGTQALAAASVGYLQGHWTHDPTGLLCWDECGEKTRHDLTGFAASVSAGALFGDGLLQPGVLGTLDLLQAQALERSGPALSITVNFSLGIRID